MRKYWADKWVKALRSGDYKQGKTHLRYGDCYDVLGVLCDLWGKDSGVDWDDIEGSLIYEFLEETEFIPSGIIRDFDICTSNEEILSNMNDSGKSFEELADYIEENYENL